MEAGDRNNDTHVATLGKINSAIEEHRYKLNAADYFINKVKELYPISSSKSVSNEFFYNFDAAIFELHSASQMILQIINLKAGNIAEPHRVNWSSSFQKKLKAKSPELFNWWKSFNLSPEYNVLESMRQFIAHRGGTFFQLVIGENDQILAITIPVRHRYLNNTPYSPPTFKSIEVRDELDMIRNFVNDNSEELIKK